MATKRRAVSVSLDPEAQKMVEKAAQVSHLSSGTFLEMAGQERAHRVLLDWALGQRDIHETTFSELAEETGLAVEEIMDAMGRKDRGEGLAMFLATCRAIAETRKDPEFFKEAQATVEKVLKEQALKAVS